MPSFFEVWPEIKSALLAQPSWIAHESEADLFGSMIRLVFEASIDARKATAAVEVLRENEFLTPEALAHADLRELEETLKAGHTPVGPKTLRPAQRIAAWFADRGESIQQLRSNKSSALRDTLLDINGIGQATADGLLLFALGAASYPVDRATYRILVRHGWIDGSVDYDEVRDTVMTAVGDDPSTLADLSRTFEGIGKQYCKAGGPRCERCPLQPWLPEGGAIEA